MRILMLTPRMPYPPHRGDTLRSWQMLQALASRHTVYLATAEAAPPSSSDYQQVAAQCAKVAVAPRGDWKNLTAGLWSLAQGNTLTDGYFARPELRQAIDAWQAASFDAILAFSGAMAPLALSIPAKRRWLDLVDVDSAKWRQYARECRDPRRWLYRLEHQRTALDEQRWIHKFDGVWVVNEREKVKLIGTQREPSVRVLPTTIPIDHYPPTPLPDEPIVSMIGSMFYRPNVQAALWFGRRVWPRVRAAIAEAQWTIVGARPDRAVKALNRLPGVTVTGTVPEVDSYLRQCRVFISPVRGTLGVQSKVLSALVAGRPCVVHADVAGGLKAVEPPPFLTASDPERYARLVIELLQNRQQAENLAMRARMYVVEHYDAERVLSAWLDDLQPIGAPPIESPKETHDSRSQHRVPCQQLV